MNQENTPQEEQKKEGFQREQREFRPGRSPRPRIHTGQHPVTDRPAFKRSNDEGGFRPEGFGAGLQSSTPRPSGYQPRPQGEGGYQPRSGYQPRGGYQSRGGYQQRPQGEGGYQPRGGYQSRGGYQPRPQGEGGYQPRGGYQQRPQGEGGYQPRSGYQPRGGYQQRGGYQPGGGYNKFNKGAKPYGAPYKKPRQHSADYDPNAKYSMKKRIEYKEINFDPNEPLRLNKFLANAGVCSRREADEFIQAGNPRIMSPLLTILSSVRR